LRGWKELEYKQNKFEQFVISGLRCEVDEKCALRGSRDTWKWDRYCPETSV